MVLKLNKRRNIKHPEQCLVHIKFSVNYASLFLLLWLSSVITVLTMVWLAPDVNVVQSSESVTLQNLLSELLSHCSSFHGQSHSSLLHLAFLSPPPTFQGNESTIDMSPPLRWGHTHSSANDHPAPLPSPPARTPSLLQSIHSFNHSTTGIEAGPGSSILVVFKEIS